MESYLNKNISMVNKNNQIIFRLGVPICNGVFNLKFNKKTIELFLNNLSNNFNLDSSKYNKLKIYYNENSVTEIDIYLNKNHYSYLTYNEQIFDNYCIGYVHKKLNYDDSLVSIFNYNNIVDIELYNLDINGLFTLYIRNERPNEPEYYTIFIIIKKPNNSKVIYEKIQEIVHLLNIDNQII